MVAAPRNSGSGNNADIWLHQLTRGLDTRFTFHASSHYTPLWSPDGRRIVFASGRAVAADLYLKDTSGVVQDELLLKSGRKPAPFLQTPFSPDGHWVAYASDESGRYEINVRPFPSGPGKSKISINGGELPRWRRDGKELFYLAPDRKLMAAKFN